MVVTSCRKLFTLGLSAVAFGHPLSGFHLAGIVAVFTGVLLNANGDMRCSRCLVLPAIAVMLAILASELVSPAEAAALMSPAPVAIGLDALPTPPSAPLRTELVRTLQQVRDYLGVRLL